MDIPKIASILLGSFTNFVGGPDTLYRSLLSRPDFRSLSGVPSNDRGFLAVLKEIGPDLRALGVEVTVLSTGLIKIRTREDAVKAEAEEARLRAEFFNPLPEGATVRSGFGGNSEQAFQRFFAYTKGVAAGEIHEARTRPNALAADDRATHAQVDSRLPLETRCRQIWEIDPKTRGQFTGFEAFLAYEQAMAKGLVRKLG